MAYQLQPGMKIVTDKAVPPVCATEEVFVYPQPSTLNYGSSRPNTMLYGTAPFMAGKGAPAQYIETSDLLNVKFHSEPEHMNLRVVEPTFKMVYFSKDILIKMLARIKNG